MVRGHGLKLPSVLRFTILCRSMGVDLALILECSCELLKTNAHS